MEYPGYVVTEEGLYPGQNKMEVVEMSSVQKNAHEVRRFLDLTVSFFEGLCEIMRSWQNR